LLPSPPPAYLLRNEPSASLSIGYKNFSNLIDLSEGIILTTISYPFFHALSLTHGRLERKSFLILQNKGLPRFSDALPQAG
jgi:hypothetical protein